MDFELAEHLAARRDDCGKRRKRRSKKRRQKLKRKMCMITDTYSGEALTEFQLNQFGESLDKEYETTHVTTIDETFLKNKDEWNIYLECSEYDKWPEKEKRIEYKNTAAENIKNEYYRALNTILSHNFEIYHIEKKPNNFRNRQWSACIGGTEVFLFYCKRNNYTFVIKFMDDCDCHPGLLTVENLRHIPSNQDIHIQCDLYGQNQNMVHIKDFLTLLESNDLDEYYDKRFGPLRSIPEELTKRGHETFVSDEISNKIHVNSHSYNYIFTVKTQKGNCLLIPRSHFNSEEYVITICLNPEDTKYGPNKRRKLDRNSFSFIYSQSGEMSNYYYNFLPKDLSNIDYEKLVKCIEVFMSSVKGKFGYYEQGSWHNHVELCALARDVRWHKINIYEGPEINVELLLHFGQYRSLPFEYYRINFYYNSHENKNCKLRIQGRYNDYSIDTSKFEINDICDYKIEGSYLQLFDETKHFIKTMNEINQ